MSAAAGFAERGVRRAEKEGSHEIAERWHLREVGLWIFLGTLVMLFAAFTSALVVRRSTGGWIRIHMPGVLWAGTAVLLMSSVTLERAKRAGLAAPQAALPGIAATFALGLLFCAGQVEAWRELTLMGLYLPTAPSASFFYVLTGVHVLHVTAALACVSYLLAATMRNTHGAEWPYLAGTVSTFWHFLTVVWIYLLFIMQAA